MVKIGGYKMKLLYKLIDYLDSVVTPYIKQTEEFKEYMAWVRYEIRPLKNKRALKLWVPYESGEEGGFLEFPIIDIDFNIGEKITICKDKDIYLGDKERKELMKLIKTGVKKINGTNRNKR